jgi:hypothetical protein
MSLHSETPFVVFYSSFYHMFMASAKETTAWEFLPDELLFGVASHFKKMDMV